MTSPAQNDAPSRDAPSRSGSDPEPPVDPASTGGLRARKKARQRSQILETAIRRFRAQGFDATTVEQITADLEISPATFYNYFPSKDAVLGEIGRVALERARDLLGRDEQDAPASAERRLRAFLRQVAEGVQAERALWRAIFATGALNRPDADGAKRATATRSLQRLEEILADGQARGEITRALSADRLAQILQGAILRLSADYVFDFPAPHSLVERIDDALGLFLNGACPDGAA